MKSALGPLAVSSKVDEGGAIGFFGIGAAYVSPLVAAACGGLGGRGGDCSVSGWSPTVHEPSGSL